VVERQRAVEDGQDQLLVEECVGGWLLERQKTRWCEPGLALQGVADAADVGDVDDAVDAEDVGLLVQDDAEDCVGAVGGWQHGLDGKDGGEGVEGRAVEDVVEDGAADGVVDDVEDGGKIVVADGVEGVGKDAAECEMEDAVGDAGKGVVEDAGSVANGEVDGGACGGAGIPGTARHSDSWDAGLGTQSWRREGSLDTALLCLPAAAAGSTGGTGSRVGSLRTGACGEQGSGLQWSFLPVGRLGAPEDLGSSLAVGLGRRWGQCRFGEVLGSDGKEGCVGKILLLPGSGSTRTDGKVPRSAESESLKGHQHLPCSAAEDRQLLDADPDEGERS